MYEKVNYNPDILSCLANLSSDEVFTSPEIANSMIDMLPQELFNDPNTKYLDPGCKSGVFLREIAKRLNEGLKDQIPDLEKRMDHIMKNQLYAIAITEITGLMSRRSVYCSKDASSRFSIAKFNNKDGNICFHRVEHTWVNGRCLICGASEKAQNRGADLETHAYEFIHLTSETQKEMEDMKFDVIIGNPPYQLSDGGAQASAIPIYNKFVEQAKKLNPRYLCMIIPARWMTGGRGLDGFRYNMLRDRTISVLHDFPNSKECFSGVEIKGGVCYFLSDKNYKGPCSIYRHNNDEIHKSKRYLIENGDSIFIRDERLISIKSKVWEKEEKSFEEIVSPMRPYGLRGDVFYDTMKYGLPSMSKDKEENKISIIGLDNLKRTYRYVPEGYPFPIKNPSLKKWKLFVTRNWGVGSFDDIPSSPVVAGPNEACTETFLEFGPFDTKNEVKNVLFYFSTKFFRAMVSIRKQDQGASRSVYHYVPMQDFSQKWDDVQLYEKYNLSKNEIDFIESNFKNINWGDDNA